MVGSYLKKPRHIDPLVIIIVRIVEKSSTEKRIREITSGHRNTITHRIVHLIKSLQIISEVCGVVVFACHEILRNFVSIQRIATLGLLCARNVRRTAVTTDQEILYYTTLYNKSQDVFKNFFKLFF